MVVSAGAEELQELQEQTRLVTGTGSARTEGFVHARRMERAWQGRAGCSPADTPDIALPDPGADVLGLVATRLTGNMWKETTGATVQTNRDVVKERPTPTC